MDKFLEWYNRHESYLKYFLGNYIYVNGIFCNKEEVRQTIDDAIQNMFLYIYEKGVDSFSDENIGSLIIDIAKHSAGDILDREGIRKCISLDELKIVYDDRKVIHPADKVCMEAINVGPNWAVHNIVRPDEYAERDELRDIVKKEINKISKDNKNYQIFLLNSEGYNYIEIGRMLGLNRQNCADRIQFIREKFRENKRIRNCV